MFRRRTFRRPFRRRFRKGFRPFAHRVRPKYDRITLYNTLAGDVTNGAIGQGTGAALLPCGPILVTPCDADSNACNPCATPNDGCGPDAPHVCCSTIFTAPLFTNGILQEFYQDRVTIVSLYGDVWCRNLVNLPIDTQQCSSDPSIVSLGQYYARYAEQLSLAIRKFKTTMAQNEITGFDDDRASPIEPYDWTEAQWLWQRHRFWAPRPIRAEARTVEGSMLGCCGDVTGGATNIVPPIASGDQPTYTIDTNINTSCNPCTASGEGACPDLKRDWRLPEPPWHHFSLRIRRHITLRADDNLNLQVACRHPLMYSGAVASGWGCTGGQLPAEAANLYIHARIGAVIRTN